MKTLPLTPVPQPPFFYDHSCYQFLTYLITDVFSSYEQIFVSLSPFLHKWSYTTHTAWHLALIIYVS